MERKFYKIKEVASMLGVHPNTIGRWIKDGIIKTTLVGDTILIPATEIERLEKGD